jgi:hypothetical protein
MADTRSDISVPTGAWLNLYTASGVTVGTEVSVINKGSGTFFVFISATAPSILPATKGIPVYVGSASNAVTIPAGSSGLWAFSPQIVATALVQE